MVRTGFARTGFARNQFTWLSLTCLLGAAAFTNADATQGQLSVIIQAKSDWLYHGTSETSGEPTVGLNTEYQFSRRFFAGFEAHEGQVDNLQQRHRSVAVYFGADQQFGDAWNASYAIKHRFFPGSVIEWDYTELTLQFAHRNGWRFRIDHANDYYSRDTRALVTEAGYTRPFGERWYGYGTAGRVQLSESRFPDYGYASAGGGYSRGPFNVDLSYQWNSNDGRRLFGPQLQSGQWVASLAYRWR